MLTEYRSRYASTGAARRPQERDQPQLHNAVIIPHQKRNLRPQGYREPSDAARSPGPGTPSDA